MKKLIFTSLITMAAAAMFAQTPVVSLDFEDGSTLPSGVELVNGAVGQDDTGADVGALNTEATDADKKMGGKSLQMANSGYVYIPGSYITNFDVFTVSFWMKMDDIAQVEGKNAVYKAIDLLNLSGAIKKDKETTGRAVTTTSMNKLTVYTNAGPATEALGWSLVESVPSGEAKWAHVVFTSGHRDTFDVAKPLQGESKLYINGELYWKRPIANTLLAAETPAEKVNFYVGARMNPVLDETTNRATAYEPGLNTTDGIYQGLSGYIDDLMLFDEELDSAQAVALYVNEPSALNSVQESCFQVFSPNKGVLNIVANEELNNATAVVYNFAGQMIKSQTLLSTQTTLSLTSGAYIVKLTSAEGVYSHKVLVK